MKYLTLSKLTYLCVNCQKRVKVSENACTCGKVRPGCDHVYFSYYLPKLDGQKYPQKVWVKSDFLVYFADRKPKLPQHINVISKEEALFELQEIYKKIQDPEKSDQEKRITTKNKIFNNFQKEFYAVREKEVSYFKNVTSFYDRFFKEFNARKISSVKAKDIKEFLGETIKIKDPENPNKIIMICGDSTYNHYRIYISAFYTFLQKHYSRDIYNPVPDVAKRNSTESTNAAPFHILPSEFNLFMQEADKSRKPIKAKTALLLACHAGARNECIRNLESQHIDFVTNKVRLQSKSDRERFIPMSPALAKYLKLYLTTKDAQGIKLFSTYPREIFENIRKRIKNDKLMTDTRIKQVTPHTLRHSFATWTYAVTNHNLRKVQNYLGHAEITTTSIYAHDPDDALLDDMKNNFTGDPFQAEY